MVLLAVEFALIVAVAVLIGTVGVVWVILWLIFVGIATLAAYKVDDSSDLDPENRGASPEIAPQSTCRLIENIEENGKLENTTEGKINSDLFAPRAGICT
jgi:hypothetical protein